MVPSFFCCLAIYVNDLSFINSLGNSYFWLLFYHLLNFVYFFNFFLIFLPSLSNLKLFLLFHWFLCFFIPFTLFLFKIAGKRWPLDILYHIDSSTTSTFPFFLLLFLFLQVIDKLRRMFLMMHSRVLSPLQKWLVPFLLISLFVNLCHIFFDLPK